MSEWIEMPRIVQSEPVTTHSFFHLALWDSMYFFLFPLLHEVCRF
jgi:hypothetical protein